MKNLNIVGVHWKIRILGGGRGHEKERGLVIKREWYFQGRGGWYPNPHYGHICSINVAVLLEKEQW